MPKVSRFTIDDAEYVQTPVSEEWYIIDLETKKAQTRVENLRISEAVHGLNIAYQNTNSGWKNGF